MKTCDGHTFSRLSVTWEMAVKQRHRDSEFLIPHSSFLIPHSQTPRYPPHPSLRLIVKPQVPPQPAQWTNIASTHRQDLAHLTERKPASKTQLASHPSQSAGPVQP
ncbi:MAG: hypothetical protein KDK99_05110, partial [Verrucomicrobiales bacterium]|nr:hypothetical protein [Verrucomicrobiales bacterium]